MSRRTSSRNHSVAGIGFLASIFAGLLGSSPLRAQSFDVPANVCLGDEFEVEWTGPNGADDQITLAEPSFRSDQSLSSWETMDGSPAELQAPGQEGYLEIRYVQADPESILLRRGVNVIDCLSSGSSTRLPAGTSSGPSGDTGAPGTPSAQRLAGINQAVLVSGVQTNYGDVIQETSPLGEFDGRIDALCGASDTIGWAMNAIIGQIEQGMAEVGSPINFDTIEALPDAPSRADIAASAQVARDELCDREEERPQVQPFTITYAYCRMAMVTPHQVMDIHLPPRIGTGMMSLADYLEGEALQLTLSRSFDAASTVVGRGWSSQVTMTSPTDGGTHIGYPTTRYQFGYEGGLGGGGAGVPFAGMVSTENSGTVWVSDAVPGLDIIRSFYENLTNEVSPELASNSFFGGLINNLVGMLRNGLPLEIEQTVESKVLGRTSVSGRSHQIVTDIRLVEFRPEWCSESLLPPGMPVRDIDQEIADAMGQSGTQSAEMAEAMQQYEQAMQEISPEQRQMMEQFGVGGMMEQMMGGGNPAGRQSTGAQGQPGTSPAAPAGGSRPSSEDLYSDNLTQMVQRHLEALGYDPGTTDGEPGLQTTIAISQFQAEQGLEVTGEVSPQLAGVLSAEVDRQR
ncbi:peptidoglycan-binding domain-containing protein [Thioalkalivibrio sp. XN8]|uniref:peptidoglycan-binding domain-containing protein n=1 Tax=Thioalkalivibrio sp. XN8 TaxID=2712863 RepID=UPI0013EAEF5D|nr:peptidoglycan-binding domain-containing protein [Thioalkalivibrio sp. XN8]NGP54445.1 peptidoglycan-binding protein [Thioalkalivibrio sp. XN8]